MTDQNESVRDNDTRSESGSAGVAVEVSDDRMQAWISLANPDGPEPPTVDEITAALEEAEVAVTDPVTNRCKEFLANLDCAEDRSRRHLVAEGQPPGEGKDGEFEWHELFKEKAKDWLDDAPVDYYSYNAIVTVEKDTQIGTLIPAIQPKDGVDVCGDVLRPRKGGGTDIQLDSTVRTAEDDPTTVIADIDGKVVYQKGRLSMTEVLEVPGDVDFECCNIDSLIDVAIKGTVLDNFEVKSKKSISVRGAIQAGAVEAAEDVLVRGGILGRCKGTVRSGGMIVAKFAEEADLRAEGDIKIANEAMNSRIHTEGHLLAPSGAIIGGDTYARESAELRALGSAAWVLTKIAVGIHPDVIREAGRISESLKVKRQVIERIREGVRPLLADLKRLTSDQKEHAAELLSQAEAMEAEITELEQHREKMLQEARAQEPPYVTVSTLIYAGVRIRIGRRHVVFDRELRGPVRIEKRKVEGVTEFVAVNELSGSITVLPSAYVVDEDSEEDRAEKSAEKPMGEPTREPAETPTEKPPAQPVDQPSEKPAQEPAGKT